MAIDFPNSPVTNDTFTIGERKWVYDGEKWMLVQASPELLVVGSTAPSNTNVIWADTTVAGTMNSIVPSGALMPFAGLTSPTGWLLCFGQTLTRTTYPDLFAVIGTTYNTGGEEGTVFRLPDLRGRTVAGQDDMGGTSANRLTGQTNGIDGDVMGGTGGSETHTLTTAQMPAHSHQVMTVIPHSDGPIVTGEYINAGLASGSARLRYTNYQEDRGGNQAHNIVQPTIILNYIIKT